MKEPVKVSTTTIGSREFLIVGRHAIPVDRITRIDLDAVNGGCDNSVRIHTDDEDDSYVWAYENADAIRAFLVKERS